MGSSSRHGFADYLEAHSRNDNDAQERFCNRCRDLIRYASDAKIHGIYTPTLAFRSKKDSNCRLCCFLGALGLTDEEAIVTMDMCILENANNHSHKSSGPAFRFGLNSKSAVATLNTRSPDCCKAPCRISSTSIDYQLIKDWIEKCHKYHVGHCGPPGNTIISGFKVIDCETRQIIHPSVDCPYAALSYIWGAPNSSPNVKESWPRTILDSMSLVLRLGHRYLWVDRYCIDQTNAAEKHTQIANMDLIYANAEVTIIAAAGDSPEYGLPGVSTTPRKHQHYFTVNDLELIEIFEFGKTGKEEIGKSVWASRAWTLQESVLSQRRLIFTDYEVIFECNTMHQRESIQLSNKDFGGDHDYDLRGRVLGAPVGGGPISQTHHRYALASDLMEECSERTLSFESDALNACLGILKHYRVQHWWGVLVRPPKYSSRLCSVYVDWFKDKPGKRREGFPSWSWTSITGRTKQGYMSDLRGPFRGCKIEVPLPDGNWQTIEEWSQIGGSIENLSPKNCLRITGSVLSVCLVHEDDMHGVHDDLKGAPTHIGKDVLGEYYLHIGNTPSSCTTSVKFDDQDDDTETLSDIVALVWYRGPSDEGTTLILLKPVKIGYKRVGIAWWVSPENLPALHNTSVTIELY